MEVSTPGFLFQTNYYAITPMPPERTTGRAPETPGESPEVNPPAETERRVQDTQKGIRNANPSRVRENLEPAWEAGERGGQRFETARIDGRFYRVFPDGRVYRQGESRQGEKIKLQRVRAAELGSLPPAVKEKMGMREGTTARGVRFQEISVNGLKYRALENGTFWRQNGTKYEVVRDVSTLPPAVTEMAETVRPDWEDVTFNGVKYKRLNIPGKGAYCISEHGQVLFKDLGGNIQQYVPSGERLPPVVQEMLTRVENFNRAKEQQRLQEEQRRFNEMTPEQRSREMDLKSAAEVLGALRNIRIESGNQRLAIQGLPATREELFSRMSKLSVRPDRYSEFKDNLQQAAGHMGKAIARFATPQAPWEGAVSWNQSLNRLETECTTATSKWRGERLIATAVEVLRQPAGFPREGEGYGGSRPELFFTLPDSEHPQGYRVQRREARDNNLTNYWMYEHQNPAGARIDYIAPEGNLRLRKTGDEQNPATIQTFGDASNTRPETVSVRGHGAEIRCTETAEPSSAQVRHRFDRTGNYALDRQGGGPVGNYQDFLARAEVPSGTDPREAYANFIVKNLKTPESIANFLSAHISFNGSGVGGAAVEYHGEVGQDVQHPLVTLERGRGDCEDFALLFDYMLEKIGVPALAMRKTSNHFICVYFEERYVEEGGSMQKRYDAVVMDTSGFRRSTAKCSGGYESPKAALRDLVHADMDYQFMSTLESQFGALESRPSLSGEEPRDLALLQKARATSSRPKPDGTRGPGGVELLYPPATVLQQGSSEQTRGTSGFLGYDADFSQYVISGPEGSARRTTAERNAGRATRVRSPAAAEAPRRAEAASTNPRAQSEIAKMHEIQQYARNQWVTLGSGAPGYQYFMDTQGHLFASREPSNRAAGYEYLNVQNYTWEHRSYG